MQMLNQNHCMTVLQFISVHLIYLLSFFSCVFLKKILKNKTICEIQVIMKLILRCVRLQTVSYDLKDSVHSTFI